MSAKSWCRKLWAVHFTGSDNGQMLIGARWLVPVVVRYAGEPSRALLFNTRVQARECCKRMADKYRVTCPGWKFKPVRIVESVEEA